MKIQVSSHWGCRHNTEKANQSDKAKFYTQLAEKNFREFPTYLKMHEIAGHNLEDIENTYKERYMPSDDELAQRFVEMHKSDFRGIRERSKGMIEALKEIEDKVDPDIFSDLKEILPKLGDNTLDILKKKVKQGLSAKGKWKPDYIKRVKEEFDVIKELGFADYFLIVADYVNWAKSQGIIVGPGRGSACNCLIAYSLGITEVDSLLFGLDFRRFLRKDKVKTPKQYWAYSVNRANGCAA